MYNAISLTNKNETKSGLKIRTILKCLFIFVDQNETKRNVYNVISSRFVAFPVSHSWSHFRGWHQGCQVFATKPAQLLLKTSPKTSPIVSRGVPVKVRIPGALNITLLGSLSTHGHEKQQFRRRQQTKLSLTPRKGPMAGFILTQFTSNTSNRHTFICTF